MRYRWEKKTEDEIKSQLRPKNRFSIRYPLLYSGYLICLILFAQFIGAGGSKFSTVEVTPLPFSEFITFLPIIALFFFILFIFIYLLQIVFNGLPTLEDYDQVLYICLKCQKDQIKKGICEHCGSQEIYSISNLKWVKIVKKPKVENKV